MSPAAALSNARPTASAHWMLRVDAYTLHEELLPMHSAAVASAGPSCLSPYVLSLFGSMPLPLFKFPPVLCLV
jgi:hypothetical protein